MSPSPGLEATLLEVVVKHLPPDRRDAIKATLRFRQGGKEWEMGLMIRDKWVTEEGIAARLLEGDAIRETAVIAIRRESSIHAGAPPSDSAFGPAKVGNDEALLQAVPPEDYFKHKDLRPVVLESVKRDARPFLALVGAPGTWDVSAHPSLPLFGIYKTNDKDNADMPVPSHWRLLLTAPGREELVVLPWEESDKLPLAEPAAATPPGTRPKTTYSFDQRWRDVPYAALPAGPKEWKAVLHAGDFLSNAITVRIAGAKDEEAKPGGAIRSPKPASAHPESERHLHIRHAGHPAIPPAGVAFAKPVAGGTEEKPSLMLWGAFNLPDPPRPEAERMRLHLLFSAPDIPGGLSHTLSIPMDFVETRDKRIEGRFGLDLAPLFRGPSGRVQVPAHLYVTPVRGNFIGQPWEAIGEGGWHR